MTNNYITREFKCLLVNIYLRSSRSPCTHNDRISQNVIYKRKYVRTYVHTGTYCGDYVRTYVQVSSSAQWWPFPGLGCDSWTNVRDSIVAFAPGEDDGTTTTGLGPLGSAPPETSIPSSKELDIRRLMFRASTNGKWIKKAKMIRMMKNIELKRTISNVRWDQLVGLRVDETNYKAS